MATIEELTDKLKTYFKKSLNTDKVSIRVTKTQKRESFTDVYFKVSAIFLEQELSYAATFDENGNMINLEENGQQ